ncbi:RNA polymerase sigma factor [Rubritalea tangerina]|uniref:RNA polymerase sigma factor n=1 Tax=Rubritalea tangerina TaxID=430798 RepID=A0ABW4Z8S6_9BACT
MEALVIMNKTKQETFAELAREHHREILVYARVLTREDHQSRDIVQESFVTAWENMERFDVTRDFGSWLRGIVRNKWRETMRRNKKQVALEDEALESMEAEMLTWQELRQDGGPSVFVRLEHCISKLPDALAGAVKRFYYEGCSTDEAAEKLEIGGATLRKRLERARQSLGECLKNQNQEG